MATTYNWSEQSNGANLVFDPTVDVLNFDSGISAANVFFDATEPSPGILHTVFTINGKTVTIQTDPFRLTTTNITFSNGSRLMIGDNNTGLVNDDNGNLLNSTLGSTVAGAGGGDDMFVGAGGADTMIGNGGNDLFVIVGDDVNGIYGADSIRGGGGGSDRIAFWDNNGFGVTVNLGNGYDTLDGGRSTGGSATGGDGTAGIIVFTGIEAVTGTEDQPDTLNANSAVAVNGQRTDIIQRFAGLGGNDTLNGATGDGRVTIAEYGLSPSGVLVNLGTGTASDGWGGTDVLNEIDAVIGSHHNDTLYGGSDSKSVNGGNFEFFEGLGGNDTIDGSFGTDRAQYDGSPSAVLVNLSNNQVISGAYTVNGGNWSIGGHAADGWGGMDTLISIEQIRGSSFNDTLVGSAWSDTEMEGRAGNDSIVGGSNDELDITRYSSSPFAVVVNLGSSALTGTPYGTVAAFSARDGWDSLGGGTDTLVGIEGVRGSDFNDTLVGGGPGAWDEGVESFEGWGGADYIDGGDTDPNTIDVAAYRRDPHAVVVNLSGLNVVLDQSLVGLGTAGTNVSIAGGTALDGYWVHTSFANATQAQRTDTLININGAEGSSFNDTLIGGSGNEHFQGNNGSDYIDGGAGTDTVYYDGPYGVVVNLSGGPVSSNFYGAGIITVAGGTALDGSSSVGGATDTLLNIENVEGSDNNDFIFGGSGGTVLRGWSGNDLLVGGIGADRLYGDEDDDQLRATAGADTLDGGEGLDRVTFTTGNGGSATGVGYSVSGATAVTVNLGAGTADYNTQDGANPLTTLVSIENAWGTVANDTLLGGSQGRTANGTFMESFRGGDGNDYIDGTAGGFSGYRAVLDRVEFEGMTAGTTPMSVIANIGTTDVVSGGVTVVGGTARDGFGKTDTLLNVNWLSGTGNADTLVGGNVANDDFERFEGRGGDDYMDGGSGIDEVSYQNAGGPVTVNLATGTASGDGNDVFFNMERVRGSNYGDSLIGGSGNEVFTGGGGNDTIDGGAGIDYASWSTADLNRDDLGNIGSGIYAYLSGSSGTVTYNGWEDSHGTDTLINIEGLIGTSNNDTLQGGAGNQYFIGRGGSDSIDGGADVDTVSYAGDPMAVQVSLDSMAGYDGWGGAFNMQGTDILLNIENVIGSDYNDSIEGSSADNLIDGGSGDDAIRGLAGNDTLNGGDGNDSIEGGAGNDSLVGGAGTDTLDYSNSPNRVLVNMFTGDLVVSGQTVSGGTASDGFGNTDVISGIENVIGSAFNDYIRTRSGSADLVVGGSGNDTLAGGGNSDTGFADTLLGGDGNDSLIQTLGNDVIDGGAGSDTLSFDSTITGGVNVNLSTGTSSPVGSGFTATISSIESVVGTSGADSLVGGDVSHLTVDSVGNSQTEAFRPGAGNDTVVGGNPLSGFQTRVEYTSNTSGQHVSVNLGVLDGNGFATASDGLGGTDKLKNVHQLHGGAGNDLLVGGGAGRSSTTGTFFEIFRGNAGNDTIDGGDTTGGALGGDRVDYGNSTSSVIVNLGTTALTGTLYGTVNGGAARDGTDSLGGGTDTLIDINSVFSGSGADTLIGGAGSEDFSGGAGADYIDGAGGTNEARYGNDASGVIVNLSAGDLITGGDTVAGGTARDGSGSTDQLFNIQDIEGSDFDDYIRGSDNAASVQRLQGGAGNDTIDGGAGVDYASYSRNAPALGGVSAFIANGSGTVSDGFGTTDTLINIEGLEGSSSGDTLSGGTGTQWFRGRGGSDLIDGGADADWVSYLSDPSSVIVNLGASALDVGGGITVVGGTARDGWGGPGGILGLGGTDVLSNIENAEGSSSNDTLVGSIGANDLRGSGGADYINGGEGIDTLRGGTGNDIFVFDVAPVAGNLKVIADFASGDKIHFDATDLTGLPNNGALGSAQFLQGAGLTFAQTLAQRIVYNTTTGDIYYDVDGAEGGGVAAVKILNLTTNGSTPSSITNTDFVIFGGTSLPFGATEGDDVLTGTAGNDSIGGYGGNDTIYGLGGADTLDGGTGVDIVYGGPGNDIYIVDATSDASYEALNEGVDEVRSSATYTLGANIENLTLLGSGNINGTGNSLANVITGNDGINTLFGGGGNDTLIGGGGNDILAGNTGNDWLDGGVGADQMYGYGGNDVYVIDDAGDFVSEAFNAGTDEVRSTLAAYTLIGNVENLTLLGSGNINGTGNSLANVITGNDGSNILAGGGGNDTLSGGAGNDTLSGGAGNDTLIWDAADGSIQGGADTDTLRIDGSGVVIDLTAISDTKITDVEIINFAGSGGHLLSLALGDVLAMSSATDTLFISAGSAGNSVDITDFGGWASVTSDVSGYSKFTNLTAILYIEQTIAL